MDVTDSRVSFLPFGLNTGGTQLILDCQKELCGIQKEPKFHLNCNDYTAERVRLKKYYAQHSDFLVSEPVKPVKEFLRDIATCKYVLCPEGNGFDCYRVYESLYLNSLPILTRSRFSMAMQQVFPIYLVDSLFFIDKMDVDRYYNEVFVPGIEKVQDKLNALYWKQKIECTFESRK